MDVGFVMSVGSDVMLNGLGEVGKEEQMVSEQGREPNFLFSTFLTTTLLFSRGVM